MTSRSATASDELSHYCVLTPPGRGAIATIAVRRQDIIATLSKLFAPNSGRNLATYPVGSAIYGRFRSTDVAQEDVVIGVCATDEAEIHCHGGLAAIAAICEAFRLEGGVEFSTLDWVGQKANDAIAAEALMALADARTERTAAILLDQHRGALKCELNRIDNLLAGGNTVTARQNIEHLLTLETVGLHLTQPWRVVFTGRPNVGKSSLMNAILGYERSIVWHQPGTTRDVLTATTAIDGWPVELSDAAGLRASDDTLEAAGVARAEREIAAAELVVFVSDLTTAWDADLYAQVCARMTAAGIPRPAIIVHNKCDLGELAAANRPAGVRTSAVSGEGLDGLCRAISRSLVPSTIPTGSAIPFSQHQLDCLRQSLDAISSGNNSATR